VSVTLFGALYAFFQEHRRCGELEAVSRVTRLGDVYVRRGHQPAR